MRYIYNRNQNHYNGSRDVSTSIKPWLGVDKNKPSSGALISAYHRARPRAPCSGHGGSLASNSLFAADG